MKQIIYISTLLLLCMTVACRSVKSTSTKSEVKDSTTATFTAHSSTVINHERIIEKRDTSVGIASRSVADTVKADDAAPVRNAAGKAKPRHFQKTEDGLTAWVHIDTLGNVAYGAKSDSFTVIIEGLTTERDLWHGLYDSLKVAQLFTRHESVASSEKTVKTDHTGLIVVILAVVIAGFIGYRIVTKT